MSDFYDTVFVKDDSSLEKKLQLLRNNPRTNGSDISVLEMGIAGENQVKYHLKKSNIGMYALHDVNIKCDELKAQIDFIVITNHHCYFIECKNYNADIIHIDENLNFEISTKYGRKYIKRGIKSPLSQVDDQLAVFKKICFSNHEFQEKYSSIIDLNSYFKTLVVFTNPENRLNMKKVPYDVKYKILKVDNLIRQIEYDNNHYHGRRLTKEEMNDISEYILNNNVDVEIDNSIPSIEYVDNGNRYNNNVNNSIKKDLINFLIAGFGCILLLIVGGLALGFLSSAILKNSNKNNTVVDKNNNNLTENQLKAISILKEGYNNSLKDGFEVLHGSICVELNSLFDNKMTCYSHPSKVKFIDNKITLYNNYSCFTLNLTDDGKKIASKKSDIYSFEPEECPGTPIGFSDWDPDNEYFKKIGGYEKIKEFALYTYKNNKALDEFFTYDHIEERGGNTSSPVLYSMNVNMYFRGLTEHSGYGMSRETSRENTNKMCESYYYIMK